MNVVRKAVRQHGEALQHAHAFQERDIGMSSWWRRKRTMPHQNKRPRNCCMTTISCCRKKEKPIIRNERLCKDHTERVPVTRFRETAAKGRKAKVQNISERTTSNRSSPNVKNSELWQHETSVSQIARCVVRLCTMRFRVEVESVWFNEFVKQANDVGHTLSELRMRKHRFWSRIAMSGRLQR